MDQGGDQPPNDTINPLMEIQFIMQQENINFLHVPREYNGAAH